MKTKTISIESVRKRLDKLSPTKKNIEKLSGEYAALSAPFGELKQAILEFILFKEGPRAPRQFDDRFNRFVRANPGPLDKDVRAWLAERIPLISDIAYIIDATMISTSSYDRGKVTDREGLGLLLDHIFNHRIPKPGEAQEKIALTRSTLCDIFNSGRHDTDFFRPWLPGLLKLILGEKFFAPDEKNRIIETHSQYGIESNLRKILPHLDQDIRNIIFSAAANTGGTSSIRLISGLLETLPRDSAAGTVEKKLIRAGLAIRPRDVPQTYFTFYKSCPTDIKFAKLKMECLGALVEASILHKETYTLRSALNSVEEEGRLEQGVKRKLAEKEFEILLRGIIEIYKKPLEFRNEHRDEKGDIPEEMFAQWNKMCSEAVTAGQYLVEIAARWIDPSETLPSEALLYGPCYRGRTKPPLMSDDLMREVLAEIEKTDISPFFSTSTGGNHYGTYRVPGNIVTLHRVVSRNIGDLEKNGVADGQYPDRLEEKILRETTVNINNVIGNALSSFILCDIDGGRIDRAGETLKKAFGMMRRDENLDIKSGNFVKNLAPVIAEHIGAIPEEARDRFLHHLYVEQEFLLVFTGCLPRETEERIVEKNYSRMSAAINYAAGKHRKGDLPWLDTGEFLSACVRNTRRPRKFSLDEDEGAHLLEMITTYLKDHMGDRDAFALVSEFFDKCGRGLLKQEQPGILAGIEKLSEITGTSALQFQPADDDDDPNEGRFMGDAIL